MPLRADPGVTNRVAGPRGLIDPLRDSPVFRYLWLGQAGVQMGIWIETVTAQWILVADGQPTTVVSWVQAAISLPVLVLGILAGVLADVASRRVLVVVVNFVAALSTAVMFVLQLEHRLGPATLLGLTAALGATQAINYPAWTAAVPDLVVRADIPSASMLASININIARVVGPAVGGFLIAGTGAAAALAVSGIGYAVFAIAAIAVGPFSVTGNRQRFSFALAAGWRHVVHTRGMLPLTCLAATWFLSAGGFWALLPVVGLRTLELNANQYGIVLGAVGGGAVIGTPLIAPLRRRAPQKPMLIGLLIVFAGCTTVIGTTRSVAIAALALPFAGLAWTTVGSILMSQAQLLLPTWVRARGLSFYIVAMQGGLALGALLWGAVGQLIGAGQALVVGALSLLVFVALLVLAPLGGADDALVGKPWASLPPPPEYATRSGAVTVINEYRVTADQLEAFRTAMHEVRRSRLRTGARRWQLLCDADRADVYVETFEVATWNDHAQQHSARQTRADERAQTALRAASTPASPPRHLIVVRNGFPTSAGRDRTTQR